MQTLKIPIPEGYEIDSLDKSSGEVKLKEKPKSIMERIITIEDALEDHGLTMQEIDEQFKGVPDHFKHQYLAELYCESVNEGWIPNWRDLNEAKYFLLLDCSSGFRLYAIVAWYSGTDVGSRLCLRSRPIAQHVAENIPHIYKKFILIQQNN